MIEITIIDDDIDSIIKLEEAIKKYFSNLKYQININKYSSPEDFLNANITSDIYFLDVEMPKINGIELAHEIRKKEKNTIIFFCTNYTQFAINGYEVNALGYLVKPISDYSISKNLNHALDFLNEKEKKEKEKIQIHSYQGILVIPLVDIIYIEVKKHNLYFHLTPSSSFKDKDIKIRGTMDSLEKALNKSNFVKTGNSFLVNLEHVVSIKCNNVILNDKSNLILSRKFKKDFLEAMTEYLNKKETIIL